MNAKPLDAIKILTRSEIAAVIADLKRKRRSVNTRQNLALFRLATCCGLRVSEIVGLNLSNVKVRSGRPHIEIPARIAKRKKPRRVPLWWDAGTLADLQSWTNERASQGAGPNDPFVCSQAKGTRGKHLSVRNAQARYKKCLKLLGPERVAMLSIHCGRHSFCSHAMAGGRTLAEVRDAAGHANISTTSIYLHVVHDDGEQVGSLFDFQGFSRPKPASASHQV
ncbi:MAG TPA: site-specific integrase [Thermoguttaceae bacterium]|nr:site-specific integrase [Thermoguttaceae bacterium]